MEIHSLQDVLFKEYGSVIEGYDTSDLFKKLEKTPLSDKGTIYVSSDKILEGLPIFRELSSNAYGGMPIQLGYCSGHNSKLNCLEYHRDSELNFGTEDFILLLARKSQIRNGELDTKKVVAFLVPKGTLVEIYSTSLHYAPISSSRKGFRVLIVLPRGTNEQRPKIKAISVEDKYLFAKNKWLIAHKEAVEVSSGAEVGLVGTNIDLSYLLR